MKIISILLILFLLTCFSQCLAVRNILLIGRTGCGKSTLANILMKKNGNFEEVFKENKFSVSGTKDIKMEEVDIDGIKYRIIDTVGIGDTSLTSQQVLNKLVDASHVMEEGLNQILFVTNGKFNKEEIEVYNILRGTIFDKNVVKYTTIVRNFFPYFRNSTLCEKDKQKMKQESREISEVISSCNKVVHVDAPPLDVDERRIEFNKEDREYSRTTLLTHLRNCRDVYKPNLSELNKRIDEFKTEKEHNQELQKKLKQREEENSRRIEIEKEYNQELQKRLKQREEENNRLQRIQFNQPQERRRNIFLDVIQEIVTLPIRILDEL